MQPLLRPVIAAIKKWAKPLGWNTPALQKGRANKGKGVTFSSYAFVMMTIGWLQVSETFSSSSNLII
jgi:hypothetical protein